MLDPARNSASMYSIESIDYGSTIEVSFGQLANTWSPSCFSIDPFSNLTDFKLVHPSNMCGDSMYMLAGKVISVND